MRKLLLALVMLCGVNAWANGKISIQPTQNLEDGRMYFITGLSIYEKLNKMFAYNSWTGMGEGVGEQANVYHDWYSSKHQLDIYLGKLTLSPGIRVMYDPGQNQAYYEGFGKLAFELWK